MNKLTFEDFKKEDGYLSFKGKKVEICLENCFNGCDIAVYDLKMNLLEPKVCTNLIGFDFFEIANDEEKLKLRARSMATANEFYEKYELGIDKTRRNYDIVEGRKRWQN